MPCQRVGQRHKVRLMRPETDPAAVVEQSQAEYPFVTISGDHAVGSVQVWIASSMIRWKGTNLQQLWTEQLSRKTEWRDVPRVEEEE